jgi:hypothetical protein
VLNSRPIAAFRDEAIRAVCPFKKGGDVNNIIYIIGLIVVILAVLSFFGFR